MFKIIFSIAFLTSMSSITTSTSFILFIYVIFFLSSNKFVKKRKNKFTIQLEALILRAH